MKLESARRRLAKILGVDLTPAQSHYARKLDHHLPERGNWLDLGCGHQFVPDWCAEASFQQHWPGRVEHLVGIDVDPALRSHPFLHQRVFGLGDQLPFKSNSFDLVSANMVLEHLREPQRVFLEVQRVLKPGGTFLFHTPNAKNYLIWLAHRSPEALKKPLIWLLERREASDVFPTFYRANTVEELKTLAQSTGFEVASLAVFGSSGTFWRIWGLNFLELGIMKALQHPALQGRESVIIGALRKKL